MTKAEQKAQEQCDRIRLKLRKLKAEKRRQDKQAALLADARLGALVREQHPELARLLLASAGLVLPEPVQKIDLSKLQG